MVEERSGDVRGAAHPLRARLSTRATRVADRPASLAINDLPATPAAVSGLRRMLVAFAAWFTTESDVLRDIAQAVSEAVANVVVHAYDAGEVGPVHVSGEVDGGALEVRVADDGLGFRAGESEGAGLGLPLIAASTARFVVAQRAPRGTEVRMRFLLRA